MLQKAIWESNDWIEIELHEKIENHRFLDSTKRDVQLGFI